MWKEPESTIPGKCPGENTSMKELWTRFEAASTHGLRFNASVPENTASKGFLDLLDEASCDEESKNDCGFEPANVYFFHLFFYM